MAAKANIAIPSQNASPHVSGTPRRIDLCWSPATTANVIHALSDGFGVEDIHVKGIADIEYARAVVRRLTDMGLIRQFYRQAR